MNPQNVQIFSPKILPPHAWHVPQASIDGLRTIVVLAVIFGGLWLGRRLIQAGRRPKK